MRELQVTERYRGPLKAVILDWGGTTIDFGCHAPVVVLVDLFHEAGIEISIDEARHDMGLLKKDHIRAILSGPRVRKEWVGINGGDPTEEDVERMFASFLPRQIECLSHYSGVIPGVLEAVAEMRHRRLRIGSTTGYTRPMLDAILPSVIAQGFCPDATITPDEAGGGRPAPWMCYLNLVQLGVFPAEACVKIGDTPSDMEEGLNAGMWTIGVLDSSNEIGLTEAQWSQLGEAEKQKLRDRAGQRLLTAGAHYVVNSLTEAPGILDRIEQKLRCMT